MTMKLSLLYLALATQVLIALSSDIASSHAHTDSVIPEEDTKSHTEVVKAKPDATATLELQVQVRAQGTDCTPTCMGTAGQNMFCCDPCGCKDAGVSTCPSGWKSFGQTCPFIPNPPPPPGSNTYKSDSSGDSGSFSCFSVENLVQTAHGLDIPVSEVQVGTQLAANDEVWWVHRVSGEHKLVRLNLKDSSWLDVTAHHLVFAQRGTLAAGQIVVGDQLRRHGKLTEVLSIDTVYAPVSAPITLSGKIMVNGVEASCYAFGTHDEIHQLLAPARLLYTISPRLVRAIGFIGQGMMNLLMWVLPIELYLSSMVTTALAVSVLGPLLALAAGVRKLSVAK